MAKRNQNEDNRDLPSQEELDQAAGIQSDRPEDRGIGNRGDQLGVDQSEAATDSKTESGEQVDTATGEAVPAGRFREDRNQLR